MPYRIHGAPQQLAFRGLYLNFILPNFADGSLDLFSFQLRQHNIASLKWILHNAEFDVATRELPLAWSDE